MNTIQLPHFIKLLGDSVPFPVAHSASQLRYISLIIVYIEFSVDRVGDDHWFYLLDKKFLFNRVTEQKNLSECTMERGKTVLSFELTCRLGDDMWRMKDEDLFDLAKADCKNISFITGRMDKITDFHVERMPNVYEIYFKQFDQHAAVLLAYLSQFHNATTIGRRGLFLQGDQHQAVEMGLRMGDMLANGGPTPERVESFLQRYVKYIDVY